MANVKFTWKVLLVQKFILFIFNSCIWEMRDKFTENDKWKRVFD
jgi:hypothetical protein